MRLPLLLFLSCFCTIAQSQSPENYFRPLNENTIRLNGTRQIIPQKYITLQLNLVELTKVLKAAPHEINIFINASPCVIFLPLPDGSSQRFRVVESPVMAQALAEAYPDIKTYSLKGIDDPYANGKIDINEFGFHGMVLTVNGDFFIDPYSTGSVTEYISYYTSDFKKDPSAVIPEAGVDGYTEKEFEKSQNISSSAMPPAICVGSNLRTFDLAVACNGEYAKAATNLASPTVAQVLAKIVTTVNRVDGVYEKEVAIRMVLVPTETNVIFTDPASDPFTDNNNATTLMSESQTVITANIGSSNFDIGHTLSTGGGGLANFGCVCSNANKAKGISGNTIPVGDPFDIDFVSHEMGHQFKASHSFNALTGACNGNRHSNAAVEPGSGVTIMGYAGICSSNDVAVNSIPYFHGISYDEIVNFVHSGAGGNCAPNTSTGNSPPVVTGSGNFTIPKSTPFILSGNGSDPDGDALTYSWEEMDPGTSGGNWNSGNRPYFRSYTPTVTPVRLFPKKLIAFNGDFTSTIGEYVPSKAQTLKFRMTARDNKMGGGGVCHVTNTITIDTSGPLKVSYPDAPLLSWYHGTQRTVTWDVNFTNLPPVDCDTVRILLTMDDGANFIVLSNSTSNDGSETITCPTVAVTVNTCRIKVESKGNIFYDVSNNLFSISTDPNVGFRDISSNDPFNLTAWPNPFQNVINITAEGLNGSGQTDVTLEDVYGRTLRLAHYMGIPALKETINLEGLSNGVYFIRIKSGNKQSVYWVLKE